MATSGGIVSIIFEADTSKIEKAFSDIEKKASKINVGPINAETKRLTAETAKLNAQFKKAHPEIAKIEAETKKIAEESKTAQLKITEAARKNIEKIKENGKTERKQIEENTKLKLQSIKDTEKASTAANKKAAKDSKEALYVYSKYSAESDTDKQLAREKRLDDERVRQANEEYKQRAAVQKALDKDVADAKKKQEKEIADFVKQGFELDKQQRKDEAAENKYNHEQATKFVTDKMALEKSIEKEKEDAIKLDEQTTKELDQQHLYYKWIEDQIIKINKAKEESAQKELDAAAKQQLQEITDYVNQKYQDEEVIRKEREWIERQQEKAWNDRIKFYYSAKSLLKEIGGILGSISNTIKQQIGLVAKYNLALLKLTTPLTQITRKLITSSGVMNRIKTAFSFNSLLNFGQSAITAASDLTEVQNIVETAFPNMTNEMEEWAKNSIDYFGLSEKSAKEYASTLGLMAQSAGLAEKASYKMGTGLTAVTADLASIYNIKQQDVYEKIRSGVIGGRTAAIAQLGINMNQANLQAYMASKGMAEKYSTLDNATKTAIRYNYVLEQTKKIQGDFLKTQGTWANQTRILSEGITQLKASLGELLVSVLTPLLQMLNRLIQLLTKAIDKFKESLSIFGIKLQKASASGNSGLSELTDDLYENADAADAANKAASKLTDGPFSEMHKLSGDDMSDGKLGNIFGENGLLTYEPSQAKEAMSWVDEFLNKLKSKFKFDGLIAEWRRLLQEIKSWIDAIKDAWSKAWNNKGTEFIQSIIDLAEQLVGLINDISEDWRAMWENGYGEQVLNKLLETLTKINTVISGIIKSIRDALGKGSGVWDWVDRKAGKNTTEKLAQDWSAQNGKAPKQQGALKHFNNGDFTPKSELINAGKEFRELSIGELIAREFYKAQIAVMDCLQAILDFIAEINKNTDWERIMKGWANTLTEFANALNSLSQWLKDHPGVAKGIGDIITWFLEDPLRAMLWATAIKGFVSTVAKIPQTLMALGMMKHAWLIVMGKSAAEAAATETATAAGSGLLTKLGTAIKGGASTIGSAFKTAFSGVKSVITSPAFILALGIEELCGSIFGTIDGIFDEKNKDHPWYQKLFIDGPANNRALISGQLSNKIVDILNDVGIGDKFRSWLAEADAEADAFIQRRNEAYTEFGNWIDQWFGNREVKDKEYNDNLTMLAASSSQAIKIDYEQLGKDIENSFNEAGKAIETFVNNTKSRFDELISKAKELGEKIKEAASQKLNDIKVSINDKVSQARNVLGLAKVRFNANGGAYKPNDPQLRVIGDSSQHEYDLTESHLDDIANRMTGAVINGFMRVSSMNTGSKGNVQPIINIQMGDEQFKDFIVRTIEENGYRFA